MKYRGLKEIWQCLMRRLNYLGWRDAYYEATAKNLEYAAKKIEASTDAVFRTLHRESVRTAAQRKRVAKNLDVLSQVLERTKRINSEGDINK